MKEVIYLVVSQNKVERMTKNLPSVYRGEIPVKLTINVPKEAFNPPTLDQEIFVEDWRQGIDLEDVEFRQNIITRDEAERFARPPTDNALDELDELLMALMVAGAIEARNSEDGKLTVEIMRASRGFKGAKPALLEWSDKRLLDLIGEDIPTVKLVDPDDYGPEEHHDSGYNEAKGELRTKLKGGHK